MKNNRILIGLALLLLIAGCDSCADTINELKDICESSPSTTYLLSVRGVDYDQIGTKYLLNNSNSFDRCSTHFAASTVAGHQYGSAADEMNRIEGSALHFTNTSVGHKTIAQMFPTVPTVCSFDYVDNSTIAFPCHPAGDNTCGSWVINTCRHNGSSWGGSGQSEFFNISANTNCYDHYSDPTSDDYPMRHGILHELAHGWGMGHTGSWTTNDQRYMSTMQGSQYHLTAVDVAYLRHRYPASMNEHRNYVAGTKTKFPDGSGGYDKHVFWKANPLDFYIDGTELKDCSTQNLPEFYVCWFNTGDLAGDDEICGVNRIFLRKGDTEIDLKTWKFATMPYLSQDQWKGTVATEADEVAKLSPGSYELVFKVNAWGTQDELTDEDNEVSYDVEVWSGSSCN